MKLSIAWNVGLALLGTLLAGCNGKPPAPAPAIQFTLLPPAGKGSPDKLYNIQGRVSGAAPGQRLVLFARAGFWWVQPTVAQPYTEIERDGAWKTVTHPGNAYAALLVGSNYVPPATTGTLPTVGGDVYAAAIAEGDMLSQAARQTLQFAGYEWEKRQTTSDRGGARNVYEPSNAWIDDSGALHLRLTYKDSEWRSTEVSLSHSLGYGSYSFVARDVSHLDPGAVFSMFTWDEKGPPREMNIEISRWGEPEGKNAQFVVQPYYVPANAIRFNAPPGPVTYTMQWTPGRSHFRAVRGRNADGPVIFQHAFTSGVPAPGEEAIHFSLYAFSNQRSAMRNECEVVIEKFEFVP